VFTVTATLADKKAIDTSPAEDLKAYQDFFFKRFQGLPLEEYANGVYAIDEVARASWEAPETEIQERCNCQPVGLHILRVSRTRHRRQNTE